MTTAQTAYATRKPLFMLLLLMLAMCGLASGQDGWRTGRTTWYDDAAWMSVHDGSCMYGYLGGRYGGEQNWHVGAMNDGNPLYAGSCGKCFEVKCEPMNFKDNYGQELGREGACSSTNSINIVMTDTCPCNKPGNEYSNQRWCCGDMDHFDIGIWAFQNLADPGLGVIGIKYRPVACPSGWEDSGCKHPHDPICQGSFNGQPSSSSSSPLKDAYDSSSGGEYTSPSPEDWNDSPSPSPSPDDWNNSPSPSPEDWSPSPSPEDWSPSPSPSPKDWSPSPSPSSEDWSPSPSPSPKDWSPSPSPSPEDWSPSPSPDDMLSSDNGDGSSGDSSNQGSYGASPWWARGFWG
ncbi:hypothetical protein FOA52_001266 [Chlamydomonas sp. UWO 241]|nr:hypothetical protein FOA52_001266 [Chlamydomonas sp. UWO 241]